MAMRITRRGLLAGAAAGGGLLVAWALYPRDFDVPLTAGEGEFSFGAWLKIGDDGVITVAVPQLEMGQGVTTVLPQIVAVELGADWRQIAVEPAPPNGVYANIPLAASWAPLWLPFAPGLAQGSDSAIATRFAQSTSFTATADGTSLAAYEAPCRDAAALARAMLIAAAARQWDVAPEQCDTQAGFVVNAPSQGEPRRLSFAQLAGDAAGETPPDTPPLRVTPAAEEPIPGQADQPTQYPRLDLPSKVDGTHLFAGDVRLPDMLYAAIRHGPMPGTALARFDADAARNDSAIVQVVEGPGWLAAVGTNWWAANRALDAMKPQFAATGGAAVDSDAMEAALDTALREGSGHRIATRGDSDTSFAEPDLALRYDVAPATHATLETATATAHFTDGTLRLWMASQAPERARVSAASALGIAPSRCGFLSHARRRQFRPTAGKRSRSGGRADRARCGWRKRASNTVDLVARAGGAGRPASRPGGRVADGEIRPERRRHDRRDARSYRRAGDDAAIRRAVVRRQDDGRCGGGWREMNAMP